MTGSTKDLVEELTMLGVVGNSKNKPSLTVAPRGKTKHLAVIDEKQDFEAAPPVIEGEEVIDVSDMEEKLAKALNALGVVTEQVSTLVAALKTLGEHLGPVVESCSAVKSSLQELTEYVNSPDTTKDSKNE